MARYRVIHRRKTIVQALLKGRTFTDWYIAQYRWLVIWREIGTFPSATAAEQACEDHAGGDLLPGGGRIVAEFRRRDD